MQSQGKGEGSAEGRGVIEGEKPLGVSRSSGRSRVRSPPEAPTELDEAPCTHRGISSLISPLSRSKA
jgi:hypothetical protein